MQRVLDIATIVSPIDSFLSSFYHQGGKGNVLLGLLAFLESRGAKYIVVEPGFSFVRPPVYKNLLMIGNGKKKVQISCCKYGGGVVYVIHT